MPRRCRADGGERRGLAPHLIWSLLLGSYRWAPLSLLLPSTLWIKAPEAISESRYLIWIGKKAKEVARLLSHKMALM